MTDTKTTPPEGDAAEKKPLPKQKKGYKVTTWKGLPNYVCDKCGFATMDEAKMIRHVAAKH
jgi:hypothetical protein